MPPAAAREEPVGRIAVVMMMAMALGSAALAAPAALALIPSLAVTRASSFAPAPLSGKAGAS
jgi:hypothetical protein